MKQKFCEREIECGHGFDRELVELAFFGDAEEALDAADQFTIMLGNASARQG